MDTLDDDSMSDQKIYLELSDLPMEVAIGLERYLSIKYPEQDVIIHRGPTSIYGHLLPELQGRIMKYNMKNMADDRSDEGNPALYTTKKISRVKLPESFTRMNATSLYLFLKLKKKLEYH